MSSDQHAPVWSASTTPTDAGLLALPWRVCFEAQRERERSIWGLAACRCAVCPVTQAVAFGQGLTALIPQLSALTDILPPPTLAWKLQLLEEGNRCASRNQLSCPHNKVPCGRSFAAGWPILCSAPADPPPAPCVLRPFWQNFNHACAASFFADVLLRRTCCQSGTLQPELSLVANLAHCRLSACLSCKQVCGEQAEGRRAARAAADRQRGPAHPVGRRGAAPAEGAPTRTAQGAWLPQRLADSLCNPLAESWNA